MPKNKPPVPRKLVDSPEQKDAAAVRQLCALALYLTKEPAANATTIQNEADFYKIIKKCLHQKNDDVLYEALDLCKQDTESAYQFLKAAIEEVAEVVVIKRDDRPAVEINAFVIPLFLHSTGGLKSAESFQDQDAFEQLTRSLQDAGLESADANVVLVNHAYQLDEIDSITFSHLHEMVRDAHAAMLDMRHASASAIERSYGDGTDEPFAADDIAVELRFLLGFSMHAVSDPFYQIPADEQSADAWFAARAARFQAWTELVASLVKRCFAPAERELDVHFLYQDLFHGGKEQGIAEYFTLQLMSDLNHDLAQHNATPESVTGVIAPADIGDEKTLRVQLYAKSNQALLASAEKPLASLADLDADIDDVCDALRMIGIAALSVAKKFDEHGVPVELRAL